MIETIRNNGVYKNLSNKCFFIAINDALNMLNISFDIDYWIKKSGFDNNKMFDNFAVRSGFIDEICKYYAIRILIYTSNAAIYAAYGKVGNATIRLLYSHSHFEAITSINDDHHSQESNNFNTQNIPVNHHGKSIFTHHDSTSHDSRSKFVHNSSNNHNYESSRLDFVIHKPNHDSRSKIVHNSSHNHYEFSRSKSSHHNSPIHDSRPKIVHNSSHNHYDESSRSNNHHNSPSHVNNSKLFRSGSHSHHYPNVPNLDSRLDLIIPQHIPTSHHNRSNFVHNNYPNVPHNYYPPIEFRTDDTYYPVITTILNNNYVNKNYH